MWRERKHFKKKVLSSLLAALLVLTSAFSSLGSITVYAAKHEEENTSKAGIAYRYMEKEDVQISVLAENENFAAGEDVHLRVFVMNNTQETLTGGRLKFDGMGIQDGRFELIDGAEELPAGEDEMTEAEESPENTSPEDTEGSTEDTESGQQAESQAGEAESEESTEEELTEDNWEDMDEPEEEDGGPQVMLSGRCIYNITLEPGGVFETEFFGVVNPELERTINRKNSFYFRAKKENGYVSGTGKIEYNTGVTTMLPVEFDNGGELLTNEENIMYLHTIVNDAELAGLFSGPSFGGGSDDLVVLPGTEDEDTKATSSNASKATNSNAVKATSSDAGKEEAETAGKTVTEKSAEADVETTVQQESTESPESSVSSTEERATDKAGESAAAESEDTGSAEESVSETEKVSESYVESAASENESRETEESNIEGTESEAEESGAEESAAQEAGYSAMVLEGDAAENADYSFEIESSVSDEQIENSGSSEMTERIETESEETRASEVEKSGDSTTAAADYEESAEAGSEEVTDTSKAETEETTASSETQAADSAEDETEEEENPSTIEEFDIKDISYEITTYGVRLRGVSVDTQMVRSSNAELVTAVGFRVADKTAPGLYFGTATMVIKYNKKTYKTSTGFQFYVTGEGEVMLRGSIDGAEIQVKGPAESFPDSEELELMVSEVPEDKAEMVAAALEKKAEEEGITVDRMKAVDLKILADGEEKELTGEVTVTFQQMKLERLDGAEDKEENAGIEESSSEESSEESEPTEETPQEEQTVEEETIAPVRARRAAARRAVEPVEEETAESEEEAPVTPVIEAAEETEESESAAESKEEHKLAVWHLDEEALELNDMGGDMDENGDVVMKTDHFSIFVVVDMGQLGGNITLTVEHWGTVKTINGSGTDATKLLYDGRRNKIGETIGYYTKDEVFDRKEIEINQIDETGKIYETDQIIVPNRMEYDSIEELSKICRVMSADKRNYDITEIWVSSKVQENANNETWEDFDRYRVTETDNNGNITKVTKDGVEVERIKLQVNSIIRFVYAERKITTLQYRPVTFYDYNINAESGTGGTNADTNFNSSTLRKNKIGAGQGSSGNKNGWVESAKTSSGLFLNKGNYYTNERVEHLDDEGNYSGIYETITPENPVNQAQIVPNIVEETLDDDYNLIYESEIADPDFFLKEGTPKEGTVPFDNYELGFQQNGDTYRLSSVRRNGTTDVLTNLMEIRCTGSNWKKNAAIYSNCFWPLDEENYTGMDAKGKSDPADGDGMHNFHFGMRFDFNFRVGDYVGPMNFYFRGDDDFWMFVDGKRVIDLGGIHSAQGQAIDLKSWLESPKGGGQNGQLDKDKVHRVSIFYMERGGFGSCCYMQFTLPNCEPIKSPSNPQTSVTVRKDWDDNNNPARPKRVKVTLWQAIDGDKRYKDEVYLSDKNNWQYTWNELPVTWPNEPHPPCTYIVKEENIEGYDSEVFKEGNNKDGWVLTVKNTLSPVKVKITKEWEDNDNTCHNRPETLKFQLYTDGEIFPSEEIAPKEWVPYPGREGVLEISREGNTWVGIFEKLPKYRYRHIYKQVEGEEVWELEEEEIKYRVREVDNESVIEADEDGNGITTLSGKNPGEMYKVFYEDNQPLTDDYVAHTKVTNTHRHKLEVEKIWDDGKNDCPYISLYELNQDGTIVRVENTVCQMKTEGTKIIAEFENLDPAKTFTVRELDEVLPKGDQPPAESEYDFEENGKYFKAVNEGELYQNIYQVKYTGPQNKGNNTYPCIQTVTIQNGLRKAKIRVAKWITNWDKKLNHNEHNDLPEDEFIIQVKRQTPTGENVPDELKKPFETGVVLKHAGKENGDVDPDKFSGYIEVLVSETGDTFEVSEIIPKEYQREGFGYYYIPNYAGEPISGREADNTVKVKPGDDGLIVVYNNFEHQDYFHDDASVDNDFSTGIAKYSDESRSAQTEAADTDKPAGKSTSRSRGGSFPIEPEPVSMLSLLPGEVLLVEREEEEELEEDDRLL